MRFILALVIAGSALCASSARAAAPVEAGKVFTGPEGEEVALVPLTPREARKFLVRVQGTGTEFDGRVLPHEAYESGSATSQVRYSTQRRGRGYTTLLARGSRYELYVPGTRNAIPVKYDEARSQKLKPEDVWAQYQKQEKDGSLAKLMAFDRKGEMARHDSAYAGQLQALNASCGASVAGTIDWSTISEELLKDYSISGYCENPLQALVRLCDVSEEAKRTVQARVKQLDCRFGATLEPRLDGQRLVWTTAKDVPNQEEFATRFFKQHLTLAEGPSSSGAPQGVEPPWGREENLGQRMLLEATSVCTDGKGHYIVVAPRDGNEGLQLYYGDGKRFVEVPPPEGPMSATSFLDPRFFNKTANASFRGMDMRVYSHVDVDAKQKACSLQCGEREVPLTVMEGAPARELLRQAAYAPNPQQYVPYALLRDSRGTYYYVDRGFHRSESKSFRVFIGPRGDLKLQKMTNVVSDSEGEIFSTKKGDLRLVLDRQLTPMWINTSKKTVELRVVPVSENLPLIYNELGVYTGARLGTPCDDQ